MTISFIGHSIVPSDDKIKELVREQIRKCIAKEFHVTCYLGGYGEFDTICARMCKELKKEHDGIETVYVMPYLHVSEQAKVQELLNLGLYDGTIYPPIENTPPKFAILKRNEWMMGSADVIIAYINHDYGGAYKSFQVAKRRKKRIININDYLS